MSRESEEKARREKFGMEPTVPATEVQSGLPDFASERSSPEASGGGSMVWVIVSLVVAVAGLFWWLSPSAPKAVTPSPSPSPTSPAATKPPATKPPVTKPASSAPTPTPPPPAPSTPAPRATPVSPTVVAASPTAPAPHKHRRRHHKKATAKTKEVKLPRLPSPPPAD